MKIGEWLKINFSENKILSHSHLIRRTSMSYKFMSDALDNNLMPIGKSDFLNLFKDLGIGEGDILIAHVSLSESVI